MLLSCLAGVLGLRLLAGAARPRKKQAMLREAERFSEDLKAKLGRAEEAEEQGRWRDAEQLWRELLSDLQTLVSEDHEVIQGVKNSLAVVLWRQGKLHEAEELHRQTLERRRSQLGADHLDTLSSTNNLAAVLQEQGKLQEAEQLHRQTWERRRLQLGEDHRDTLGSTNNLAAVLQDQGKLQEAEQLHRQVLERRRSQLGDDHPDTLSSTNNLATVLQEQGKLQEAEELHRQSLERRRSQLGQDHPDTLSSTKNLAIIEETFGRRGERMALKLSEGESRRRAHEAEQQLRQAVEGFEAKLGESHPDTLQSRVGLARLLATRGHLEEAVAEFQKAVPGFRVCYGEDHGFTHTAVRELERLQSEMNEPELQRNLEDLQDFDEDEEANMVRIGRAYVSGLALELGRRGSETWALQLHRLPGMVSEIAPSLRDAEYVPIPKPMVTDIAAACREVGLTAEADWLEQLLASQQVIQNGESSTAASSSPFRPPSSDEFSRAAGSDLSSDPCGPSDPSSVTVPSSCAPIPGSHLAS